LSWIFACKDCVMSHPAKGPSAAGIIPEGAGKI
jgi:hypothetical protein